MAPVVPIKAALFPPGDVRLSEGPFRQAQEWDREYLLRLEPDRLLVWMRRTAGLTPQEEPYGGWDPSSGQIGHYLSACAQMTVVTDDSELRRRVDAVVAAMAAVQRANGDNGLYDRPAAKEWWMKIAAGEVVVLNSTPWYAVHKIMAGLRDAWLLCGSEPAREALVKKAEWCLAITAGLSAEQWQEMLGPPEAMGEFGGPHEVLADVYALTGDRRFLDLAARFRHDLLFIPLARGDDSVLIGKHANTQFPKFIGYERLYELTGDPDWHTAARNFWQNLTSYHAWANGGNSEEEILFASEEFNAKVLKLCGPETCNTYNMLKLTEQLYTLEAAPHYIDYYERALYNHILSTITPDCGFVYFTPMRPGHYRTYSRPFDSFWCCVCTGMENHARYGRMIYAAGDDRLFVNLFIPSTLHWRAHGLTLRQTTTFPQEPRTRLSLTCDRPRRMTLSIRCPAWIAPGAMPLRVNGTPLDLTASPSGYSDVTREWRSGDCIEVDLPMRVTAEPLPGSRDYAAFFYGPILLAGPLGTEGLTQDSFTTGNAGDRLLPLEKVPVVIGTPEQAAAGIMPAPGPDLAFRTQGSMQPHDVTLLPFYQIHFQRYAIYWPCRAQADDADRRQGVEQEPYQAR